MCADGGEVDCSGHGTPSGCSCICDEGWVSCDAGYFGCPGDGSSGTFCNIRVDDVSSDRQSDDIPNNPDEVRAYLCRLRVSSQEGRVALAPSR